MMNKKYEIENLKESINDLNRKFDKLNKTMKILLEFIEEHAEEKDKEAISVLKKTLMYWG